MAERGIKVEGLEIQVGAARGRRKLGVCFGTQLKKQVAPPRHPLQQGKQERGGGVLLISPFLHAPRNPGYAELLRNIRVIADCGDAALGFFQKRKKKNAEAQGGVRWRAPGRAARAQLDPANLLAPPRPPPRAFLVGVHQVGISCHKLLLIVF